MNQILDTGDGRIRNSDINYGNYNKKQKIYKEKSVIEINKIVIFFSISILILGICIILGSIYGKSKIKQVVEESARPTIDFDFNEEESSVTILAKHVKGITQISYKLNNEEEKTINGNNQKSIETIVKLEGGKNTIVVKAIDENNHIVEYEHEYVVGKLADISLQNVENAVKMIVKSEEKIKTITYNWDDGEEKIINVGSKEYTEKITTLKGKHTLKIVVLDENGIKTEKTQVVIGATAPEIKVSVVAKGNEYYYVINITDETILKNVKIILENEEKVNIDVNSKTYSTEIKLQDNSTNKITIQASNENLTTSSKKQLPLPLN